MPINYNKCIRFCGWQALFLVLFDKNTDEMTLLITLINTSTNHTLYFGIL